MPLVSQPYRRSRTSRPTIRERPGTKDPGMTRSVQFSLVHPSVYKTTNISRRQVMDSRYYVLTMGSAAPAARLPRRTGADRRLGARLVRGARRDVHPAGVHGRCNEPVEIGQIARRSPAIPLLGTRPGHRTAPPLARSRETAAVRFPGSAPTGNRPWSAVPQQECPARPASHRSALAVPADRSRTGCGARSGTARSAHQFAH